MLETRLKGLHRVLPPRKGKNKGLPAFQLTVLYAQERRPPLNRKPLSWKLITNLPIESRQQAVEKLDWYALRWNIESFFKALKSGCKAEDTRPSG